MTPALGTRLTPPALAKELGISPEKVLTWIRSGELPAANLAESIAKRPRWSIARADVEIFLARRAGKPIPSMRRRRVRQPDVIEFF